MPEQDAKPENATPRPQVSFSSAEPSVAPAAPREPDEPVPGILKPKHKIPPWPEKKKKDPNIVRRWAPSNNMLYTQKEFENWYGGLLEWHGAAGEHDDEMDVHLGGKLKRMLNNKDREAGHKFLIDRGVTDEAERIAVMDKLDPPRRPKPSKEEKFVDKPASCPAAAAAIAAGEVAFVTVAHAGNVALVANCLASHAKLEMDEVALLGEALTLTVHCADDNAYGRLTAMLSAAPQATAKVLPPPVSLIDTPVATDAQRKWFHLDVMRRALETHKYAVFVNGASHFERAGGAGHCVEALATAADPKESGGLSSPPHVLMMSNGIKWDGTDSRLGLRWKQLTQLAPKPTDGRPIFNERLAKYLAAGKVEYSLAVRAELTHSQRTTACLGACACVRAFVRVCARVSCVRAGASAELPTRCRGWCARR